MGHPRPKKKLRQRAPKKIMYPIRKIANERVDPRETKNEATTTGSKFKEFGTEFGTISGGILNT